MTTPGAFQLRNVPLLSRVGLGRADELRTDAAALEAGWNDAHLMKVDRRNQVLISGGRVVLGRAAKHSEKPDEQAVFLGLMPDGKHVWAVRGELEGPEDPQAESEVLNLRQAGAIFDDVSSQLVATATALLNWHEGAHFSPIDGAPTKAHRAGWARINTVSGHEDFPRQDPAVICLIHDGHDRAVLARQTVWPERLFSLIAGFVEAGESFETCVVREVAEEIGLDVRDVTYLGSQPWPFPRSLMVGFHAIGDPEQEFFFSDGEIAEAAWFTRTEVRDALAHGDWSSDSQSRLLLPGVDLDCPRDHRVVGVQPLDVGVQPLDVGVQPLDVGVQPLDVGVQPLDVGVRRVNRTRAA